MNQVIKVYKQEVPAMKFVGKKYNGEEGYANWGDFFGNGWFDVETEVPDGFECYDFDEGNIGVCWNYGKEEEVHDVGENWKYIMDEGMEFWTDERGAVAQFENGLCPRFTTPDEKGNVILDYCFYVK